MVKIKPIVAAAVYIVIYLNVVCRHNHFCRNSSPTL